MSAAPQLEPGQQQANDAHERPNSSTSGVAGAGAGVAVREGKLDADTTNGASASVPASAKATASDAEADALITSPSPTHPANLIPSLCRAFYNLGWVTGTGGGTSIKHGPHIFLAPSGVQKEKIQPQDIFVMEYASRKYLRRPQVLKPSQCTPLFLAAFDRGAGCCIHTHSQWAVLVTLLVQRDVRKRVLDGRLNDRGGAAVSKEEKERENEEVFEIEEIEQIKGIPRGRQKAGYLGYYDRLRIPVIENTAHEEDLTESLEAAMDKYPDAYAVLVKRHGVYVWGDDVHKAKTQAESLDYIFQLAVRMRELDLPWTKEG